MSNMRQNSIFMAIFQEVATFGEAFPSACSAELLPQKLMEQQSVQFLINNNENCTFLTTTKTYVHW